MERIKSSLLRLIGKTTNRNAATPIIQPDELPRLEGEFTHENYPATSVTDCLTAYGVALAQIKSDTRALDLRATLDQIAIDHDALTAELIDFNQRADKLSSAILALTAAAKPLQEPGIGAGDRTAIRDSLSTRADKLQVQRDAYESDAKAFDARVTDMVRSVDALRNDIVSLCASGGK